MTETHFPIEAIAAYPLPGMAIPGSFAFSLDGRLVTFLFSGEGSLVRQLYALDIERQERFLLVQPPGSGFSEEDLSPEEKLRRERQRQRELGVTSYAWSEQGKLLIPFPGGLYIQDHPGEALRLLVSSEAGAIIDPRFSPDGEHVAYVQDDELYVIPAGGGEPRQVTSGARGTGVTHGLAEYIAQEELLRQNGYWWSPDSRLIAFEEADERRIPLYTIVHQGKDQAGPAAQEQHRYPFAGAENALVRLGVVSREGGGAQEGVAWLDLNPESDDFYLARVDWMPDGRLAAQVLNREQTRLDLIAFDLKTGRRALLLTETSDVWINLHDGLRFLNDGRFLWLSERTGFRHIELRAADGSLIRALTEGSWLVDGIAGVDEAAGRVYFVAGMESPLEAQLYAVLLEGGPARRITTAPGMHAVTLSRDCARFVDVAHSAQCAPRVTLRSTVDGAEVGPIHDAVDPRVAALRLSPPEMVTLTNRAGDTLYGAIYRPDPAVFGPGPYPAVISVYGGPHAQTVTNGWGITAAMRAQYLRGRGYLVFALDNRGSARRGLAFEGAIRHRMGHLEVEDQVDGARWLVSQGLADPNRVGIYGWSYGGYMAAMCLARAPETFKVAVAGAPVTSWDGYDTGYTERYMGTPQSNPEGYAAGSVMRYVDQIRGRLLLVHGLIDENVHFRHTARLINALIHARKEYDLLLFPDERHMPRALADRVYMEQQVAGYFDRYL